MKKLICLLLSALCMLQGALFAQKQQKTDVQTEVFTKNYKVNAKDILEVQSSFTEVVFQEWDKNEVAFTTTVTLNNATEKEMEKLLNAIKIVSNQSGKTTHYKLTLSGNNLNKIGNYKITLLVEVPKDIFLNINSSFGKVDLKDAYNNFKADIDFGNLSVRNLLGNTNAIVLNQSKLNINQADQLNLKIDFSKGNLIEVGVLTLESSFSTLKIDKANQITLSSSQDKISILNSVDKMKGDISFGTLEINSLKYSCILNQCSFSKVTIDEMCKTFTDILISASQSTIVLNVPRDQSFALDYSGSFTKFKNADIRLNDATLKSEGNSVHMRGIYGKNLDSGKRIKIEANFGSVSLFE